MRRSLHVTLSAVAIAATLCGCAPVAPRIDLLGTPASSNAAVQRTIVITPDTQSVNVTSGETIRFIVGERSFAWNFQTGTTVSTFDLNQVAPPRMLARRIVVYVAINPLYISNS